MVEIQYRLRGRHPIAIENSAPGRSALGKLPKITRVLALAIYIDDMIRRGDARDYADVGRLSCLCRERVSQLMRLNYLAPDLQVEILFLPPIPAGLYPISETDVRKIANHLSWADQRRMWAELKRHRGL